jgi:hypothetical protein
LERELISGGVGNIPLWRSLPEICLFWRVEKRRRLWFGWVWWPGGSQQKLGVVRLIVVEVAQPSEGGWMELGTRWELLA